MTILAFQAAKHLGQKADWKYSNLEYQKLIYIAHVFHLGAEGRPLVWGDFEAWKYGPVHPELYRELKVFGAAAVPRSFLPFQLVKDVSEGTESQWLDDASEAFPPGNGARLVAVTRLATSAWTRHYKTNLERFVIPTDAMIEEYRALQQ